MMRYLYTGFVYLAMPVIMARLYIRSVKMPAYRERIRERFGELSLSENFDSSKPVVWIHAVSVGETVAAAPLVMALLQLHPEWQIFFTTTTPTGSDRVKSLFRGKVAHSYLPYDLPFAVERFLDTVNPTMLILMETELWPNLVHLCSERGVKLILANARLSKKSSQGYARFPSLTRGMLEKFDRLAAQAPIDGDRLVRLGADPELVEVPGSLKFYISLKKAVLPDDPVFKSVIASERPVIIAGSTRQGEEARLLPVIHLLLEKQWDLLIIVVPRHPQRFDEVAEFFKKRKLKIQRRSEKKPILDTTQILLGDSMGESLAYYKLADIAFVGGSLVDTGCHNVLEPAALGLPVVVGPSQYNFATICAQLEQAGGLKTVANAKELGSYLIEMLDNPEKRKIAGAAAKQEVEANRKALPRLITMIREEMAKS